MRLDLEGALRTIDDFPTSGIVTYALEPTAERERRPIQRYRPSICRADAAECYTLVYSLQG